MSEFRTQITIARTHPCLSGHFPGHPIVPGVVLLEAVADALKQWRGEALVVSGFSNVKFVSPLKPDECMDIALSFADHSEAPIRFRCEANGRLLAQGSVTT